MFDQILEMVKEHMGGNPQIAGNMPAGRADEVNNEIASHIHNGMQNGASAQGGIGNMLSSLMGGAQSGNPITSAIEGGLVSSLGSKFGLPPMATGAIAAALPSLLQKFARRANDPNDNRITQDGLNQSFQGNAMGGLGSLFGQ